MPELPEVETIRGQLSRVLVGQRIKKIKVLRKESLQGPTLKVEGKKIVGVDRRAKVLIVRLTGKKNLLIHLKMTGQLIYDPKPRRVQGKKRVVGGHPTADWVRDLPSKHTRVVLEFNKGVLFFNDMRVFGWIKVVDSKGLEQEFSKLGPDVNSRQFTVKHLTEILASSSRAVKLILLDQNKLAGVGNIYANEALWCAGVKPQKSGKTLARDRQAVKRLFKCLKKVIAKGIKYGWATASDDKFVTASGLGGKYQEHFLVYERLGEKCKRRGCKGTVKKIKLAGRGTYFCNKCQNK